MIPKYQSARVSQPALDRHIGVQGGVAAGTGGFYLLVRLAQDRDHLPGPGLQAAGAEFRDGAAAADDVGRELLDAGQLRQQPLIGLVAIGDQEPGEEPEQAGDVLLPPRAQRPPPGQLPAGGADDQPPRPPPRPPPGFRVAVPTTSAGTPASRAGPRAARPAPRP